MTVTGSDAVSTQRTTPWTEFGLHLLLLLGSVIMLAPFAIMLMVSLLPSTALLTRSFPLDEITLSNYVETFQVVPFARYYLNSTIVAVSTTVLQMLIASMAAYAFARLRFRVVIRSSCSTWPP